MKNTTSNIIISDSKIKIRLVVESDAEFILKLRNDERLKMHISPTSTSIADQIEWIKKYKKREQEEIEFYFIFEDINGKMWGTIRLYNITDESFTIGSWLCLPGENENIAIKSWLLCIQFGFEKLNYNHCLFDIRKTNKTVLYFAKLFKPELINQDELNFYFNLDKNSFLKNQNKVNKFIK